MGRHKLKKFAEIEEFDDVFSKPEHLKGKWREEVFGNCGDVVVELGCAHGDYARALGKKFPEKNFIGIDRKGDRIWSASKKTERKENVVFCWGEGDQLDEYFAKSEINEIWITFPDPHSKPCRSNKRLISPRFLEIYKKIVKKGGIVHLKTDNNAIFDYSVEILEEAKVDGLEIIKDVHSMSEIPELLQIKTFYEKKYMEQGKPILYLKFKV